VHVDFAAYNPQNFEGLIIINARIEFGNDCLTVGLLTLSHEEIWQELFCNVNTVLEQRESLHALNLEQVSFLVDGSGRIYDVLFEELRIKFTILCQKSPEILHSINVNHVDLDKSTRKVSLLILEVTGLYLLFDILVYIFQPFDAFLQL
jgi:hypothetical protein